MSETKSLEVIAGSILQQEKELQAELETVSSIFSMREGLLDKLRKENSDLVALLQSLSNEESAALLAQEFNKLHILTVRKKKAHSQQSALTKKIIESESDCLRARERLKDLNDEILNLRVERKKIEALLNVKSQAKNERAMIGEELANEENRGSKGK